MLTRLIYRDLSGFLHNPDGTTSPPKSGLRREINENEENGAEDTGKREVSVKIYDIRGRFVGELLHEELIPGNYSVTRNGRHNRNQPSASGIYLYHISTSGYRVSKK